MSQKLETFQSEEMKPISEEKQKPHYGEFQESLKDKEESFRSVSVVDKLSDVFRNITVEPIMFSFFMAVMLTAVIGQSLVIRKFCLLNLNRTEEECKNLTNNKPLEKQVQPMASNFNMIKSLIEPAPALIYILFMGSWSDKFGRKPPLILSSLGGMTTMAIYSISAYFMREIPPEAMLACGIPLSCVGGFMGLGILGSSYIADTSTPDKRTLRIALLQLATMVATPLGTTLGGVLFSQFGYLTVFITGFGLMLFCFFYIVFVLKETVVRSPETIKAGCCGSFFDFKNVKEIIRVLVKKREHNHRTHIILVIIVMAINMFPMMGEMNITYMYSRLRYQWSEEMYSYYTTAQMAAGALGLLVGIPILSLAFKLSDATIGLLAAGARICSDLIVGLSTKEWMLFIACPVAILSGNISPVTRSLVSKCVDKEELGKVYSLIGACENVMPAIAGVLYTQIYNHTLGTLPGAIYFMSAGLYIIPAALFRYIIINLRKHNNRQQNEEKTEIQLSEDAVVHL